MDDHYRKLGLWQAFCDAHSISGGAVPLFRSDDLEVATYEHGQDGRLVLLRSEPMEQLILAETTRILSTDRPFDGLLYMACWKDASAVIPLYIGKAGKHGRSGRISANLQNLERDRSKFARWGSNYAYHIGDLSAVVCPGHAEHKAVPKYRRWADRLFDRYPSAVPKLRRPVFFWTTAWTHESVSIWPEYGSSSLSFQEYLLIGVASDLFPNILLNEEGVNRRAATTPLE